MTFKPIAEVAKGVIDRTVKRMQGLHEYAGRPAWEHIVADEITMAMRVQSMTPLTAQTLRQWSEALVSIVAADEAAIKIIDGLVSEMRAAAYQMEDEV